MNGLFQFDDQEWRLVTSIILQKKRNIPLCLVFILSYGFGGWCYFLQLF